MDKEAFEKFFKKFQQDELEKLIKISADMDCIQFFLESAGLKRSEEYWIPPLDQKYRNSLYKKMKRKLQKKYGEEWKTKWKEYKGYMKDISKKGISLSDTHGCILKEPTKKKPKVASMHIAIVLLRQYFIHLTGRPHWKLISEIIEPYYHASKKELLGSSDLAAWWYKEKQTYSDLALDEETFFHGYYSIYKNLHKKT